MILPRMTSKEPPSRPISEGMGTRIVYFGLGMFFSCNSSEPCGLTTCTLRFHGPVPYKQMKLLGAEGVIDTYLEINGNIYMTSTAAANDPPAPTRSCAVPGGEIRGSKRMDDLFNARPVE